VESKKKTTRKAQSKSSPKASKNIENNFAQPFEKVAAPRRARGGKATELGDYKDKPEYIQFAIDCYACYYSVYKTWKALQTRYEGQENYQPALSTVRDYRNKYLPLIMQRRKELSTQIPILDPTQRWQYAQELYEMATEGVEVISTTGKPYRKKDLQAGVSALKLSYEMAGKDRPGDVTVTDEEVIRELVKEAFENTQNDHKDWSTKEVVNYLLTELPTTAQPYIEELGDNVA
jgi:hypothetical protein